MAKVEDILNTNNGSQTTLLQYVLIVPVVCRLDRP